MSLVINNATCRQCGANYSPCDCGNITVNCPHTQNQGEVMDIEGEMEAMGLLDHRRNENKAVFTGPRWDEVVNGDLGVLALNDESPMDLENLGNGDYQQYILSHKIGRNESPTVHADNYATGELDMSEDRKGQEDETRMRYHVLEMDDQAHKEYQDWLESRKIKR